MAGIQPAISSPHASCSRLTGGIVWDIGLALMKQTDHDLHNGRPVNANLAEYHVPVNANARDIDIIVVDEDDPHINSLGAKDIGEIGIVGVGAAIANAVWHATGKRVRDLPITLDKLLSVCPSSALPADANRASVLPIRIL